MRLINLKLFIFISLFCLGGLFLSSNSLAEDNKIFSNTGLPLPRFVSLAKNETNVRAGPGQKYPIRWVVNRKSLPVEVILEYDNWRKIKDHEGQEGWVFRTLLSGKRTAVIIGNANIPMYEKPFEDNDKKSRISIKLEPSVNVLVKECSGRWCSINVSGFSGWIERKSLWGVYEHENFN